MISSGVGGGCGNNNVGGGRGNENVDVGDMTTSQKTPTREEKNEVQDGMEIVEIAREVRAEHETEDVDDVAKRVGIEPELSPWWKSPTLIDAFDGKVSEWERQKRLENLDIPKFDLGISQLSQTPPLRLQWYDQSESIKREVNKDKGEMNVDVSNYGYDDVLVESGSGSENESDGEREVNEVVSRHQSGVKVSEEVRIPVREVNKAHVLEIKNAVQRRRPRATALVDIQRSSYFERVVETQTPLSSNQKKVHEWAVANTGFTS